MSELKWKVEDVKINQNPRDQLKLTQTLNEIGSYNKRAYPTRDCSAPSRQGRCERQEYQYPPPVENRINGEPTVLKQSMDLGEVNPRTKVLILCSHLTCV